MSRRPCRRGLALPASSRRLRLAEREDLVLWVSEEVWEDVESGLVKSSAVVGEALLALSILGLDGVLSCINFTT
jgi:hypothetical protein